MQLARVRLAKNVRYYLMGTSLASDNESDPGQPGIFIKQLGSLIVGGQKCSTIYHSEKQLKEVKYFLIRHFTKIIKYVNKFAQPWL